MTTGQDDIDFREQLERYVRDGQFQLLIITLLSGDKYFVVEAGDLVICEHVVLIIKRGGESLFPFEAICNIDVTFR